jgi:hypothetical protein
MQTSLPPVCGCRRSRALSAGLIRSACCRSRCAFTGQCRRWRDGSKMGCPVLHASRRSW